MHNYVFCWKIKMLSTTVDFMFRQVSLCLFGTQMFRLFIPIQLFAFSNIFSIRAIEVFALLIYKSKWGNTKIKRRIEGKKSNFNVYIQLENILVCTKVTKKRPNVRIITEILSLWMSIIFQNRPYWRFW